MEDKFNQSKAPCLVCKGKGFYCVSDAKPGGIGTGRPVDCELCDGTGIKPLSAKQGYWMYVPDGALCTVCGKLAPNGWILNYCPHCKSEIIIEEK